MGRGAAAGRQLTVWHPNMPSNEPYLDSSRNTHSMIGATTGSDCSRISGLSRERQRSGP